MSRARRWPKRWGASPNGAAMRKAPHAPGPCWARAVTYARSFGVRRSHRVLKKPPSSRRVTWAAARECIARRDLRPLGHLPALVTPFLHKVRVAGGLAHDVGQGVFTDARTRVFDRLSQGGPGVFGPQRLQVVKSQEPLGVRLGVARERGDLRHSGIDKQHRQPLPTEQVQASEQRFEVRGPQTPKIIDEQRPGGSARLRGLAHTGQEVGQIAVEVPAVSHDRWRLDVQAARCARHPGGRGEGAQRPQRVMRLRLGLGRLNAGKMAQHFADGRHKLFIQRAAGAGVDA